MEALNILKKFFAGNKLRLRIWLILIVIPWTAFLLFWILIWIGRFLGPSVTSGMRGFVITLFFIFGLFFSLYFLLPCIVFLGFHFSRGIGVWPADFIGAMLSFIFYVFLASYLVISLSPMPSVRKK